MQDTIERAEPTDSQKIPKKLHQIWLQGPDLKFEKYRPWQKTWTDNHPDWEYTLWSGEEIEKLIAKFYGWFLPYYKNYPHWIQQVDVGKYFILDHFGGVYVDMDMRSVKPIDDLVETAETTFFASANNTGVGGESVLGSVNNCIIGSTPHHPLWSFLFQALPTHHQKHWLHSQDHYIHESTGILRFTAAVTDYQKETNSETVKVFPAHFFSPVSWADADNMQQTLLSEHPESYAIHGYSGSWVTNSGLQLSAVFRKIYPYLSKPCWYGFGVILFFLIIVICIWKAI